jgi:hypothetical protein
MRWNPFRRQRPTGRHARPVYPTGPSAAATLVVVAAGAAAASSAPTSTPSPSAAPAPLLAPAPAEPDPASPEVLVPLAVPGLGEVATTTGAVGLGFTDGAAVELAQDDPRAASLRAAAAALLEHPAH